MSDASHRFVHDDPKKIRSKHRRRILSLLSDGEATVSLLSSESGLRMPHVSAEISRMRVEGLATSDLPPGSRGARIRLTEDGWRALEDDEWSKVIELKEPSSNSDYCCVLSGRRKTNFVFFECSKRTLGADSKPNCDPNLRDYYVHKKQRGLLELGSSF
ncbi:MAG: hypothetical protein Ct9H90mP24_6560 [Methanobacteriota archaeon]|nr:MAG: hypothetical protein Ct9H90mP24_6560 [Euryarchaeota archaeon]